MPEMNRYVVWLGSDIFKVKGVSERFEINGFGGVGCNLLLATICVQTVLLSKLLLSDSVWFRRQEFGN